MPYAVSLKKRTATQKAIPVRSEDLVFTERKILPLLNTTHHHPPSPYSSTLFTYKQVAKGY